MLEPNASLAEILSQGGFATKLHESKRLGLVESLLTELRASSQVDAKAEPFCTGKMLAL
jgi:hypothetical protein